MKNEKYIKIDETKYKDMTICHYVPDISENERRQRRTKAFKSVIRILSD